LPAQNYTYVHYLTQYNKTGFDHIIKVLEDKNAAASEFPNGSVNVKSAWVEMKGFDPARFYVHKAWVPRPPGPCEKIEVGLVGLHIVQKTPARKRWIWSTFEQVDNAPNGGECPLGVKSTFNDGKCTDMPKTSPCENKPDAPPKVIFDLQRLYKPISPETACKNAKYQLKFDEHSKWRYYQLVMTQWPIQSSNGAEPQPQQAGDPSFTFPGRGAESAFANSVMETFFQGNVRLSCMGCHSEVASLTDFVWSLRIERPDSHADALNQLRKAIVDGGVAVQ
jgi:hypothetical protein